MTEVYLLVNYRSMDIESYTYFLEEEIEALDKPEEIARPGNEKEGELLDSGKELLRYETEHGDLYRVDTEEGDLLYGEEGVLDELFHDTGAWGEKRTKNPLEDSE